MDATAPRSDFVQGSSRRRASVGVIITRLPIYSLRAVKEAN